MATSGSRPAIKTLVLVPSTTSRNRDDPDGKSAGSTPDGVRTPKRKLMLPLLSVVRLGCNSLKRMVPNVEESQSWTVRSFVVPGGSPVATVNESTREVGWACTTSGSSVSNAVATKKPTNPA